MFKFSDGYQKRVEADEVTLRTNYLGRFRGTVRVRLDNLAFCEETCGALDEKKKRRLKQIFTFQGCLRLKPENHVQALISEAQLQHALQSSQRTEDQIRQQPREVTPVELSFPLDFELVCLNGQHRIAAAKELLFSRDRWWCVDLYSEGRSSIG
jgi:uncharacterized protein YnzC (UPF0291/DUF896 family)